MLASVEEELECYHFVNFVEVVQRHLHVLDFSNRVCTGPILAWHIVLQHSVSRIGASERNLSVAGVIFARKVLTLCARVQVAY